MTLSERQRRIADITKRRILYFDSIGSTNTFLKQFGCLMGFPVVIAKIQTDGRGRRGKSFYSQGGAYFSVPYVITGRETKLSFLTLVAGLAVRNALFDLYGIETQIKWPNDIYFENKKLCGILVETVWGKTPFSVIGIGINVNTKKFPEMEKNQPTSLILNGIKGDTDMIIARCVNEIYNLIYEYNVLEKDNDEILSLMKKHSYTLGKNVEISNGVKGRATDILADGSIVIKTPTETKTVSMGEVNII